MLGEPYSRTLHDDEAKRAKSCALHVLENHIKERAARAYAPPAPLS
jgi:hypothetical protein